MRSIGLSGRERSEDVNYMHVEGQEEEHRDETGKGDELSHVREPQPVDAKDRQRRERVLLAALVDDKGDEQHQSGGEPANGAQAAPANQRRLDERVDEEQQPTGGQDGSDQVEVLQSRARPIRL